MAVAELAAGGTIPFVPANGGQHAIVRDEERLLYDSQESAVEKIDTVLSNLDLQPQLRWEREEIRRRFSCERFHEEIRMASQPRSTERAADRKRIPRTGHEESPPNETNRDARSHRSRAISRE